MSGPPTKWWGGKGRCCGRTAAALLLGWRRRCWFCCGPPSGESTRMRAVDNSGEVVRREAAAAAGAQQDLLSRRGAFRVTSVFTSARPTRHPSACNPHIISRVGRGKCLVRRPPAPRAQQRAGGHENTEGNGRGQTGRPAWKKRHGVVSSPVRHFALRNAQKR